MSVSLPSQPDVEGLECVIDGVPVVIAVDDIEQVTEYELSPPLPMAQPWVAGLGVAAGGRAVVASITLRASGRVGGLTKAVLMRQSGGPMPWALEVDQVRALVRVEVRGEAPRSALRCPAAWLSTAVTADGRELSWVIAANVARDLTSAVP